MTAPNFAAVLRDFAVENAREQAAEALLPQWSAHVIADGTGWNGYYKGLTAADVLEDIREQLYADDYEAKEVSITIKRIK